MPFFSPRPDHRRTHCLHLRPGPPQHARSGPERLLVLINAPANGDRVQLTASEIEQCTTRTFATTATMRPDRAVAAPEATTITTPAEFAETVSGDGGRTVRPGGAWRDGGLPSPGLAQRPAAIVSGGGQRASRSGRPDGGTVRAAGGAERRAGPDFSVTPPARRLCLVVCRCAQRRWRLRHYADCVSRQRILPLLRLVAAIMAGGTRCGIAH